MDKKTIHLFGVPYDLGGNTPGSRLGPGALRMSGLWEDMEALGYQVVEWGDVLPCDPSLYRTLLPNEKRYPLIKKICGELAKKTYDTSRKGDLPVLLGGDHSFAIGSISGISTALQEQGKPLGLIWIDAHADINTPETSPSGNLHGMPVAALLGHGLPDFVDLFSTGPKIRPEHLVLIGLRNLDQGEKDFCHHHKIHAYTMADVDRLGMNQVMGETLARLQTTGGIHVSIDADGLDPLWAPGVSTPEPGGLTPREVRLAMEQIAGSGQLLGVDLMELNPLKDRDNKTAFLLKEILLALLGRTIL
jgi:arginase